MHLYSSTSDAEPGKAYRWRGAPVPCVCWYMYLQTSSQEYFVSRPHTLPMSVWYDFPIHHLLRNRCMKPSVVAMQKTVPLCCDRYQMHHVSPRLCLSPSHWWHSVLVLIVDDSFFAISLVFWSRHQHLTHPEPCIPLCACMPLRPAQICHRCWTDYHWLSTMCISPDDKVICCSGE